MKEERYLCDFCNDDLGATRNGFAIEIRHSEGGWGQSVVGVQFQSDEICKSCWKKLMTLIDTWKVLKLEMGED